MDSANRRRAVKLFREEAEGHREQNLQAAKIIVSASASFGGRFSGLVQWSRWLLRRERARLDRMRARRVAA